jgi:hypothetical protein
MVKQVLICAAARSGSTLLDMLLGEHSRIESLGEIDFLGKAIARNELCSCGQSVRVCATWENLFQIIREERGIDLIRTPYALRQWDTWMDNANADYDQQTSSYLFRRLVRRAVTIIHYSHAIGNSIVPLPPMLKKYLGNTIYTYDLIRRLRGVDMVVDSSKEIYKAISVYLRDPGSTRIILLIRDGRGVLYSRLYSGVLTGESPISAIGKWRKYYSRALDLVQRWVDPSHVSYLRYEDLVAKPDETVTKLYPWLGVQADPLLSSQSKKLLHIAGGNDGTKARFKQGIQLDNRWLDGLNQQELDLFDRLAGRLNRRLGYA